MNIPKFKYHPNPIETGAFIQGNQRKCDCCNENTSIWYASPFYTTFDDIDCIWLRFMGMK